MARWTPAFAGISETVKSYTAQYESMLVLKASRRVDKSDWWMLLKKPLAPFPVPKIPITALVLAVAASIDAPMDIPIALIGAASPRVSTPRRMLADIKVKPARVIKAFFMALGIERLPAC